MPLKGVAIDAGQSLQACQTAARRNALGLDGRGVNDRRVGGGRGGRAGCSVADGQRIGNAGAAGPKARHVRGHPRPQCRVAGALRNPLPQLIDAEALADARKRRRDKKFRVRIAFQQRFERLTPLSFIFMAAGTIQDGHIDPQPL